MVVKWIQKIGLKKGALHRQLGVPLDEKIPVGLLDVIIKAEVGDVVRNSAKVGFRRIRVTRKIERRAILARNLRKL